MTAQIAIDAATVRSEARLPTSKLIGLVLVALLPALFWTAILAIVANAIGMALSTAALLVTAAAIVLFLTIVYAAMTAGADNS